MECKIKALDSDNNCITGEPCSDMKCNAKSEYIPPEVAEVKKPDYGVITFGKFKGTEWVKLRSWYLEYLMSDDCHTPQVNKDKARACLNLKKIVKGQLELRGLKS